MTLTISAEPRTLVISAIAGLSALGCIGTSVPIQNWTDNVVTATSVFASPSPELRQVMVMSQIQTSPAAEVARTEGAPRPSAQLIRDLRDATGFTWEQLSQLFSVSRRTVHLWAAGGRMAAANEEALVHLLGEVHSLSILDPKVRRVELLALLDRTRASHAATDSDINRPAPTYARTSEVVS